MSNTVANDKSKPYWRDKNTLYLPQGVFDLDLLTYKETGGITYQVFFIDGTLQYKNKYGSTVFIAPVAQKAYREKLAGEVMNRMMADE